MQIKATLNYLKYILVHKCWVWIYGRKVGVPLWNLFWHDWTKFFPDEFLYYRNTFYDSKTGKGQYLKTPDFALAWNLHQKRNKHHWQAWVLIWDTGVIEAIPMDTVHIKEMYADWCGAGKMHGRSTKEYYQEFKDKIMMHPNSRLYFENLIEIYKL